MGSMLLFSISFLVPILGIFYIGKKSRRALLLAAVGALTFYVSQGILRIPLLQMLDGNASFQVWVYNNMFFYILFLCFSAGLFEEIGRLISFKCLKKTNTLWEAIAFGLGHGGIEAIMLVGIPALSTSIPMSNALLAGSERLAAILIHVTLSIVVYVGVKKHKAISYTLLAILLHGIFNLVPQVITYLGGSLLLGEAALYVTAIILFIMVYFLIIKGRIKDEEIA